MKTIRSFNPSLDQDPFGANNEIEQVYRDRVEVSRQNQIRQSIGLPAQHPRVRQKAAAPTQPMYTPSASYTYRIRVRNDSGKTIRSVEWVYVFLDPVTKAELGRHQFESDSVIRPDQTKDLASKIISPPTGSIDAKTAGTTKSDLYVEQIKIQSVIYADGSVWQAPPD